jgi:hypothetical protein
MCRNENQNSAELKSNALFCSMYQARFQFLIEI